jgi:predicted HAD superfamily Cof-like phosphohydrolase
MSSPEEFRKICQEAGKLAESAKPIPDETLDEIGLVEEFHKKFDLGIGDVPNFPPQAVWDYRMNHLVEEFNELRGAYITLDFVKLVDSLMDLTILIKGTAIVAGVTADVWRDCFREVHEANMRKVRSDASDTRAARAVKPQGWVGPEETLRAVLIGSWDDRFPAGNEGLPSEGELDG